MNLLKEVEKSDVFIFSGLALLGTGLFLFLGLGISLSVIGAVILAIGLFGK